MAFKTRFNFLQEDGGNWNKETLMTHTYYFYITKRL